MLCVLQIDSVKRQLRVQMCKLESKIGAVESKMSVMETKMGVMGGKMDKILELLLSQRPDRVHPA